MSTMEERMATVESWKSETGVWIKRVDTDLYGRNGDIGMVRDYRESKAEHTGQIKLAKWLVWAVGAVNVVLGIVITLDKLHILPR